ncbi:MAG: hypothetical protein HY645_11060 [Acidobacteria bacterium]|nr:hypothetical protein [Acidobacteriota bacterium]
MGRQPLTTRCKRAYLLLTSLFLLINGYSSVAAQRANSDCSSYAAPPRVVQEKTVGVETCLILEEQTIHNAGGTAYQQLEIILGGSLEGYIAKAGRPPYPETSRFTDYPEYALAQRRNLGPYSHGFSRYKAEKDKNGLTVFLPESPQTWNGKLYMVFHGGGQYSPLRELLPRKPGEYNRLMGHNQYVGLMLDKGYAVAYTRRPASKAGEGDQTVVLDDGTVLEGYDYVYHIGLLRDWTLLAENLLKARLGSKPQRTYWYGRSAGAMPGHMINYIPGANVHPEGGKLFDGMLLDDSAGGLIFPTFMFTKKELSSGSFQLKPDVTDHWKLSAEHRQTLALQIDIPHLGYSGDMFVGGSYPEMKREHARLLKEKGLDWMSRTYEVAGVSHGDAGAAYPSELWKQNLDLSGIFDALIDLLDRWVEQGIQPPPTHSDALYLGDANGDGILEHPAIALPEVACPLGVYAEFLGPKRPGSTGFAAYLPEPQIPLNADTTPLPEGFSQDWLEPIDSRGRPLDMNRNGVRDTRESIAQAWQRRWREGKKTGVLAPGESFTSERYASCVTQSATILHREGFLSEAAMKHYIQEAQAAKIGNRE